jgi:YidC/Oxa1 family membrane protein insertase
MLNNDFEDGSKGSDYKETGKVDWVGISSRYFVSIMMAEGFDGTGVIWDANNESKGKRTGMFVRVENIPQGSVLEKNFKVCVVPKKSEALAKADPSLKYTFTSKWKEPLVLAVLWCLDTLYGFLGNYGWALIIFSIFTKLIFLPLTKKSTESMKKMSALSPLLQELKAKHKDRPDVLQKETMKLYREQGVNPMGGCLPILIQMPFFFALYSALGNSLELFDAPFIFWIKDLSMPDVVATLPFSLPIINNSLAILPIIMGATTFFQQKLTMTDSGVAGGQQMMMKIMPIFMLFIFWNMPSGLVIYWIIQNVLQIAHQLYINKKEA